MMLEEPGGNAQTPIIDGIDRGVVANPESTRTHIHVQLIVVDFYNIVGNIVFPFLFTRNRGAILGKRNAKMRFHKSNNLYGDGFFNTIFEDVSGVGANDEPAIDNQLFKIGGTGKSIIPNGIDRKEVVDVTDDKSVQYHGKCFARSVLRGIPKRGHSDGNRTAFTFLNDDLKSLYVILVDGGFDETELEGGVELNAAP
jgi:hypothetical protein